MRFLTTIFAICLLSLTTYTTAFPHYVNQRALRDKLARYPRGDIDTFLTKIVASLQLPSTCPNATYKVDHVNFPYQAPGPNDKRGPCPGLNAMANHGYLPRNGLCTARQIKDACNCVAGMSDVVTIGLLVLGVFPVADLKNDQLSLGFDVANNDPSNPTTDVGLCHHIAIEKDASLVGVDVGLGGNCTVDLDLWEQLKRIGEGSADPWNPITFADASYLRYQQSKRDNPTFVWEFFQYFTMATTCRIAWQNFPYGLPKPNTFSQYSWFVNQTIPSYFKQNVQRRLTVANILEFVRSFFIAHPDPQWATTVQLPSREECYNCWYRFLVEDTYVGYSNVLGPLYELIAPYSTCTVLNCPRTSFTTTPSPPTSTTPSN